MIMVNYCLYHSKICIHIYTDKYIYMTCVCMTNKRLYTVIVCMYIHIHMYICIQLNYTDICICIYILIQLSVWGWNMFYGWIYVCVYASAHICMYVCIYSLCVCVYIHNFCKLFFKVIYHTHTFSCQKINIIVIFNCIYFTTICFTTVGRLGYF